MNKRLKQLYKRARKRSAAFIGASSKVDCEYPLDREEQESEVDPMERIENHPILGETPERRKVTFTYNGKTYAIVDIIGNQSEKTKIEKENILVIYDDMDIEPGKIKIRKKGSSGGHNGMKSIIQMIGTEEFPRIRIGIGRPAHSGDEINHVIGAIPEDEIPLLDKGIEKAKDAVIEILKNGVDIAMNKFN